MPAPRRSLASTAVEDLVTAEIFAPTDDRLTGLELEWLTFGPGMARPELGDLTDLCAQVAPRLPCGGGLSIEPGGQLELSTLPHPSAGRACEAAATDLLVLDRACGDRSITLVALGADPVRHPVNLQGEVPRYSAMERYFDALGPSGVHMMTNSASIQVNVANGRDDADVARRWRLCHRVGPTLVAAFANAAISGGSPSGSQSVRALWWEHLDPGRTRPVPVDEHPVTAWTRYATEAPVMVLPAPDGCWHPGTPGFSFGRWMAEGHPFGWPTLDDLRYHLGTLFPPVRPRGWLEVRYLDALPTPFWHVAVTVLATLLDDDALGAAAARAVTGTEHLWSDAARSGLALPALGDAAEAVFSLVLDALSTRPQDAAAAAVVDTYREIWVARRRTPADDRLDRWHQSGELVPPPASPIPYADFEAVRP